MDNSFNFVWLFVTSKCSFEIEFLARNMRKMRSKWPISDDIFLVCTCAILFSMNFVLLVVVALIFFFFFHLQSYSCSVHRIHSFCVYAWVCSSLTVLYHQPFTFFSCIFRQKNEENTKNKEIWVAKEKVRN